MLQGAAGRQDGLTWLDVRGAADSSVTSVAESLVRLRPGFLGIRQRDPSRTHSSFGRFRLQDMSRELAGFVTKSIHHFAEQTARSGRGGHLSGRRVSRRFDRASRALPARSTRRQADRDAGENRGRECSYRVAANDVIQTE